MPFPPIHRVVTGHDPAGRAVVSTEGPLPRVQELAAAPGVVFHEVWSTSGSPAPVDNGTDPTTGPLILPPPANGTRLRFVDFPPETPEMMAKAAEMAAAAFAEIGDAGAATGTASAPHPFMHRTETVDYGVVIEGEMTLVLDTAEVPLGPGSVVIQRGTNHAWANRSGRPCRMLFVLIDGTLASGMPAPSGTHGA